MAAKVSFKNRLTNSASSTNSYKQNIIEEDDTIKNFDTEDDDSVYEKFK